MNNLSYLPLLEKYILENGASNKFNVPFLTRKNKYNVELQNWADYQDLRKGIITIRQSGIRVKSPDCYPCLTYNPVIPIIYDQYDQGYRYLNQSELLSLQSFPATYQFPKSYSLTKIASLLGNSVNQNAVHYFLQTELLRDLKFVDLFCGIGGFHLTLRQFGSNCILATDENKNCREVYQLNFPATPFLLGDINDKEIQKQIIATEFDLLCAGFPCQPFSRAGLKAGGSLELNSLLVIIKKKQPRFILLESVPHLVKSSAFHSLLANLLSSYQIRMAVINPKDLGIPQNRPRVFIWGQLNKPYEH